MRSPDLLLINSAATGRRIFFHNMQTICSLTTPTRRRRREVRTRVHRVKVVPQRCADSPSPNTTLWYWFLRNRSASQVKKDPLSRKYLVIDSLFVEIAHDDTKLKKSDSSSVNSWGSRRVPSPIHRNLNLLHQPEPAELPNSHQHSWYYWHPDGWRLGHMVQQQKLMFEPNSRAWMLLHKSYKFPTRVFTTRFLHEKLKVGWFPGGYVIRYTPWSGTAN